MTNAVVEKRRITVALNPENSQALRLLAALRGANQKDLVNEFLSRSGLTEALQAEMEGVSHKVILATPAAVAQEDKGEAVAGVMPSPAQPEEDEDDRYGELAALRQRNQTQVQAGQAEGSTSVGETTNDTAVSGAKNDDDIPW